MKIRPSTVEEGACTNTPVDDAARVKKPETETDFRCVKEGSTLRKDASALDVEHQIAS